MKPTKKIGILGGAGPGATAKFFTDIIEISQHKYKAEQDTDFPIVHLYNMPMDGFNETGFTDIEVVKNQLIEGVKTIEKWGSDFIVLPCNTIHYFINDMRSVVSIPIISIIESAVDEIKKNNFKKVGILSSSSTRDLGLYKNPLEKDGRLVVSVTDGEQKILDDIVLAVMSGTQSVKELSMMQEIINRMKNDGADVVILGCTELPLAISKKDSDIPLINTIAILAEKAVDQSYTK